MSKLQTEKQIAEGNFADYEVLIIPQASNVLATTLTGLKSFIQSGKKVIIMGNNSLSKNEYNNTLSATDRVYVLNNSTVIPTTFTSTYKLSTPNGIEYGHNFIAKTLLDFLKISDK